jgi:hypothetical protein
MFDLEKDTQVVNVPTRIKEREGPLTWLERFTGGSYNTQIVVVLNGVEHVCDIDLAEYSVPIDVLIAEEESGIKRPEPDYRARWDELTNITDTVNRYVVIAAELSSPTTCTLGIRAVGLDPNDADHFFIRVVGSVT